MTIKLRFALLLGLLLGALGVALFALRQFERREMGAMVAEERQTRALLLNHWLDSASRALPQFTSDTAQSGELAVVLARNAPEAARKNLASNLAAAGADWLWVINARGEVIFDVANSSGAAPPPALAAPEFVELVNETPSPRFFAETDRELIEVSIRRMQTSGMAPGDWLMVGRRWGDAQLRALAALTDATATLLSPPQNLQRAENAEEIELLRPLNDWHGHPLRVLRLVAPAPEIASAIRDDWRQVCAFAAFGLLVLAAMAAALQQWILRPLRQISLSLASDNTNHLASLAHAKSELGHVAQLVIASSEQRRALQLEIAAKTLAQEALQRSEAALRRHLEDRARLGRDLHDGVIQSLYAAGMGLAGIRALLKPEQGDAAARLEQTRTELNETIHDVRNFIIGLEPEALKLQTFTQAVSGMLNAMRSMRAYQSTLDIDESLANQLTLAQRVHALQITREAVSNALRHGRANRIHVVLRPQGEFAEFEVSDDGSGFDAAKAVSQGKGLANFAQRARELGAELTVQSERGAGTRVKLIFSLLIL